MLQRMRPSAAMIVAVIALVATLGGSAVADDAAANATTKTPMRMSARLLINP